MDLNEHIGILIRNVDYAIANFVKNQLEPFNLAPEQNLLMMLLWKQEGICPNEFAKQLNKDKASIARMISSLESKGFIRRVDNPNDRRTFKVFLTDEGRSLREFVIPVLQSTHMTATASLSNGEQNELKRLLSKVVENIQPAGK